MTMPRGYAMPGRLTFREWTRLLRYRARRPDMTIRQGDFGEWHAEVPAGGDSRHFVVEERLDDLLDQLERRFPHPPDG
jgi:hypothetical protein